MTYEEYQKDLKRRQKKHLKNVQKLQNQNWVPCMHDSCPSCIGTGIRADGSACIHMIACSCPKCSPSYTCEKVDTTNQTNFTSVTSNTFIIDENFPGQIFNS